MGDPKKPKKKYITPGHPWQKARLMEEIHLVGSYGLRNKRELWRHQAQLAKFRRIAKQLLGMPADRREKIEKELLGKLYRLGIVDENATIDTVLGLTVEDILERRLQTLVYKLGMAKTPHQARQFIIHGHIQVDGQIVRSPSFLVPRGYEDKITFASTSPFADPDHPIRKMIKEAIKGESVGAE